MGIRGIASHTLKPGSALKRDKVYVFDLMNVLYSMLGVASIADLLLQSPAVPTREVVSLSLSPSPSPSLSLSLTQHTHSGV